MELVPLKVKIGLRANGTHAFPAFNEIDAVYRDNMDWSHFVDKFGGWHYDQVSGHDKDDLANDSPRGMWLGLLLVPVDFAQAAITQFPTQCSISTEAEAEDFYENRGHIRDAAIREDTATLQAIKAKRDLGIVEDQSDLDALNPDHPAVGRRTNKCKTWSGFKTERGISVKK